MKSFSGLIAAAYTPFDAAGELNLPVVPQQVAYFRENGIAAAFVCGTSGEAHSLTVQERQRVAEAWQAEAPPELPVIVHVGHNCQKEAAALAAHAEEIGAAAIAAMAPSYFRPSTVEDLVDFLAPVAEAAPSLRFYYYDIPSMTGVRFPADEFLARAERRIPTLAGIKYTSDDFLSLQSCLRYRNGKFEMLFGNDELLLLGYTLGCQGAVGSTYNYAATVYHRVIEAFKRHDLAAARREQAAAAEMVKALLPFGILRAGKAMMQMQGIDCGSPRPPFKPMDAEERTRLYAAVRKFDVFPRPPQPPKARAAVTA